MNLDHLTISGILQLRNAYIFSKVFFIMAHLKSFCRLALVVSAGFMVFVHATGSKSTETKNNLQETENPSRGKTESIKGDENTEKENLLASSEGENSNPDNKQNVIEEVGNNALNELNMAGELAVKMAGAVTRGAVDATLTHAEDNIKAVANKVEDAATAVKDKVLENTVGRVKSASKAVADGVSGAYEGVANKVSGAYKGILGKEGKNNVENLSGSDNPGNTNKLAIQKSILENIWDYLQLAGGWIRTQFTRFTSLFVQPKKDNSTPAESVSDSKKSD